MRLCIGCRFYEASRFSAPTNNLDKCTRLPAPTEVSPVTGDAMPPKRVYCEIERADEREAFCGPEGRFWEPRAEDPCTVDDLERALMPAAVLMLAERRE